MSEIDRIKIGHTCHKPKKIQNMTNNNIYNIVRKIKIGGIMRRNKRRKKQRKIVVLSMICLLSIMTVGYAAFQTNLNITAKGNIKDNNAAWQLKKKVINSGDGIYKDQYEDNRYIYRGSNPDNYITFNHETWRIISVESDETLKIIRNQNIGNILFDSKGLRDSTSNGAGGTYCAQGSNGCNAWATNNNFVNIDKRGSVLKEASLNTYLNGTYLGTIKENSKYIINHDFNVGPPGNATDTEDIATDIQQEALYKWNGKIGLMSITDILRTTTSAGCTNLNVAYNNGSKSVCSNNNWMWPESVWLWTISPFSSSTNIWIVGGGGFGASTYAIDGGIYVLPVLYLTPNITLSGEGTSTNPYTINS